MSLRTDAGWPASCSGRHVLRRAGEHGDVRRRPRGRRGRSAMPKSVMRTLPSPSIITLAGFRSRCSTPRSCAAAMPAQSCRASSIALSCGIRPMRRSSEARSSPSMYSMVRKRRPPRFAEIVEADDVLVRDLARRCAARCGTAPACCGSPPTPFGQELQRDRLIERQVVGAIDLAHAAATEQRDQAIAAGDDGSRREPVAGRRRHVSVTIRA